MRNGKPFDFPHFHAIYRATPGGALRLDMWLIAEN
jgi:hypothetical protein